MRTAYAWWCGGSIGELFRLAALARGGMVALLISFGDWRLWLVVVWWFYLLARGGDDALLIVYGTKVRWWCGGGYSIIETRLCPIIFDYKT